VQVLGTGQGPMSEIAGERAGSDAITQVWLEADGELRRDTRANSGHVVPDKLAAGFSTEAWALDRDILAYLENFKKVCIICS
jgi:hypothetical protein